MATGQANTGGIKTTSLQPKYVAQLFRIAALQLRSQVNMLFKELQIWTMEKE